MATLHSYTCPICGKTFEWEGDTQPEQCPFCFAPISMGLENNTETDVDDIVDEIISEDTMVTYTDTTQDDISVDTEQFIQEMLGGFSDDSEEDLVAKIKQDILDEAQSEAVTEDVDTDEAVSTTVTVEETILEESTTTDATTAKQDMAETSSTDNSLEQPSIGEQEGVSSIQTTDAGSEEDDATIATDEPINIPVDNIQNNVVEDTATAEIDNTPAAKEESSSSESPAASSEEDLPGDGADILDISSIEELIAEESAIQDSVDSQDITEMDVFEALAQEAMQKDRIDMDSSVENDAAPANGDTAAVADIAQPDVHNLAAAMQAEGEPARRRVVRRNMDEDILGTEDAPRTPVRKRIPAEALQAREQKRAKAQKRRGAVKYYIIAAAALIVVVFAGYFGLLKPMGHYNKGVAYVAEGQDLLALSEFSKAGGYGDAKEKSKAILAPYRGQAIAFENHFAAEGKYAALQNNVDQVYYANFETHTDPTVAQSDVGSFVIYKGFAVAVRANGDGGVAFSNLTTTDNPVPDLQGWESVQSVKILSSTLVGTKEDGTHITSDNIDVSRLTQADILTVNDTLGMFGVRKDGTVSVPNALEISTKKEAETLVDTVSKWKDIVLVEGTPTTRIVGLTSTGRVKVAPGVSKDTSGADKTSGWRNIVDVASGQYHTVGLQADGTVVATGNNDYGQCNVSEWTDIIAIEAGNLFTIGLKKDGTVIVTSKTGSYIPVNFTDAYIPEPIIFDDATLDNTDPDAAPSESTELPVDNEGMNPNTGQ